MTNKNVIEIIERLMDPNADRLAYNAEEVFTAIVYGYYYIRPEFTKKFAKKIRKILDKGIAESSKAHSKTKGGIPFDEWILGKVAADALCVARSMFDREYFVSQISKTNMNMRYDNDLLEDYLYCLDEDEMRKIWDVFGFFTANTDAFISDEDFDGMMEEFKDTCLNVVNDSPDCYPNHYEHIANINNTIDFFFDYLCKESIIDVICSFVNRDRLILANMINAFLHSDIHTAVEYTGMAIYIEDYYEVDVCDPIITDMAEINFDDCEGDNAKIIHRNKGGSVVTI